MASWVRCPALGLLGPWQLSLPTLWLGFLRVCRAGLLETGWSPLKPCLKRSKWVPSSRNHSAQIGPSLTHIRLFTLPRTSANFYVANRNTIREQGRKLYTHAPNLPIWKRDSKIFWFKKRLFKVGVWNYWNSSQEMVAKIYQNWSTEFWH